MAWRIPVIALCSALVFRMLVLRTSLPGSGAALLAIAALLALGGWAFHVTGDRRLHWRRDSAVGLAAGMVLAVLSRMIW